METSKYYELHRELVERYKKELNDIRPEALYGVAYGKALHDLGNLADSQGSVNAVEISVYASAAGSAAIWHRLHCQEQDFDEAEL